MKLSTALKYLGQPVLLTPDMARELALRIRAHDPRAFRRPSGPLAFLRKVGLAKPQPLVFDMYEDDEALPPPPTKPAAYAPLWLGEPDAELDWGWAVKDGVALLNVDSPLAANGEYFCGQWIHGYDTLAQAIREADEDARVEAMFIRFDTPGGVVASGLEELALDMSKRGPSSETGAKPIWAFCEMACSAGYWLASQCDRVIAPAAGLVGSIGAVMVHEDYSGALDKFGVVVTPIQFGAHKTDGAEFKPLSAEAREDWQAMIDDIGETFLAAVARGRTGKMDAGAARATEARVYTAQHSDNARSGLALGLVDAVMSEREAFLALRAEISESAGLVSAVNQLAATAANDSAASAADTKRVASATRQPAAQTIARAAHPQENPMKLRAAVAALAKAKAEGEDEETFKGKLKKLIAEDDEREAAEEETEADAEGEDDEVEAESDDEDVAAEGEDDEEDKPEAKGGLARAQAILDLPEAKGRDKLARELAFTPGMTMARAKKLLAASAKASALANRMRDPELSADGDRDRRPEARKVADECLTLAGIKPRKAG